MFKKEKDIIFPRKRKNILRKKGAKNVTVNLRKTKKENRETLYIVQPYFYHAREESETDKGIELKSFYAQLKRRCFCTTFFYFYFNQGLKIRFPHLHFQLMGL